jgi:tetratricopeptide (TPR) repeat protein
MIHLEKRELTEAKQLAAEYLAQSERLRNPFRIRAAHLMLGRIENAAGNFEGAITELEQANQEQAWTLFHLAEAYEGKGDLARAKELYEQAAGVYQIGSITYAYIRLESAKRAAALGTQLSL